MTDFQLILTLPQIYLLTFGLLALIVGLWSANDGWFRHALTPAAMAVVGLVLALVAQGSILFNVLPKAKPLVVTQFFDALTIDAGGVLFGMLACLGTLIVVLMSLDYYKDQTRRQGEYYFLLMYSCCAATMVSLAADILTIYLTIEFLSITSYLLVGIDRQNPKSIEAAIKYFLFGGVCSAVMLYGMSLIFGFTGTLNLALLTERLALGDFPVHTVWVAVILVLTGFAFKLAAVPFHLWAPDVYEGAPTPVTAFLSVVSKAAGLAVLLRVLWTTLGSSIDWMSLVVFASAISMTLGNLSAILQRNVKRMLAYSSIAQAGYLLIGYAALGAMPLDPGETAIAGIFIYVLGYLFANLGAFACIVAVGRQTGSDDVSAYSGLMKRSPLISIALVVFFLSLAGLPPTLGFAGKFWLFMAAFKTNIQALWWLAAIGVANSVISVYYYFNVTRAMFFEDAPETSRFDFYPSSYAAIWICAVATIVLLVVLQPVASVASSSAWMFFSPK